MEEIWKDIEGYEDRYQISNFGRVKSLPIISKKFNRHYDKILTPIFEKNGYCRVNLKRNGDNGKRAFLHRLVAKAFIPNPTNLPQVNHKDGNKLNNRVENLEWCNASQNVLHAYRTGLAKHVIPHYRGVLAFRFSDGSFVGEYKSQHEAARELGLNQGHICSVLKGRKIHTRGFVFQYSGKEKNQNRTY